MQFGYLLQVIAGTCAYFSEENIFHWHDPPMSYKFDPSVDRYCTGIARSVYCA
jgi:hypothetical protein